MPRGWEKIEQWWPVRRPGSVSPGYDGLVSGVVQHLAELQIGPLELSHFGIVVADIDSALERLARDAGGQLASPVRDWVQSYAVHVARGGWEDVELEFIQPAGESFFRTFLDQYEEGLNHVSFRVRDIEAASDVLLSSESAPAEGGIRRGSHGKVAFFRPRMIEPLLLEFCQPLH